MRMDRQRDIFRQRSHFNRENALCNQFSGACADDAYTQHTFALRIENQLGHSFRSVEGHRSPLGGPGEFRDFKLAILFLRFRLGEATPGNLGIGENNCRNGIWRSEEHTSELQSPCNLVCRLLLEKKKMTITRMNRISHTE